MFTHFFQPKLPSLNLNFAAFSLATTTLFSKVTQTLAFELPPPDPINETLHFGFGFNNVTDYMAHLEMGGRFAGAYTTAFAKLRDGAACNVTTLVQYFSEHYDLIKQYVPKDAVNILLKFERGKDLPTLKEFEDCVNQLFETATKLTEETIKSYNEGLPGLMTILGVVAVVGIVGVIATHVYTNKASNENIAESHPYESTQLLK